MSVVALSWNTPRCAWHPPRHNSHVLYSPETPIQRHPSLKALKYEVHQQSTCCNALKYEVHSVPKILPPFGSRLNFPDLQATPESNGTMGCIHATSRLASKPLKLYFLSNQKSDGMHATSGLAGYIPLKYARRPDNNKMACMQPQGRPKKHLEWYTTPMLFQSAVRWHACNLRA